MPSVTPTQFPFNTMKNKGFSLVELAIVLVILGLLTGGVLTGQSLIRAAELRSVTGDYSRFVTATQFFYDKYLALPGDLPNATNIWGAAHATPATCRTTASTSALTCDGNNDGIIVVSTGSNESHRFWQHLANAGLIEGQYSGIREGITNYSVTAANAPAGEISNSFWFAHNWGTVSGGTTNGVFDGEYNNFLELGGVILNNDPANPIFKPEELWNIDTKIDDGKPGLGEVVVRAVDGLSTCTTATGSVAVQAAAINSDYLLTGTQQTCAAIFRNLF